MANLFGFINVRGEASRHLDADPSQLRGFRSMRSEYVPEKKTSPGGKAGHPTHNGLIVTSGVAMMSELGGDNAGVKDACGRPYKLLIRPNGDRSVEWVHLSNHRPPASITSHAPSLGWRTQAS